SSWSSMLETDEKIFRLAVAGAYALGVDEALADRATRYHMAKNIIGYAPELPEDHDQLLKCWFVGIWELAAREIKSCEDGSDAFSKLANQEWTSWYEEEYMPVWCEYTDAVLLFAYYAGKESIEAMGVHV